MPDKRLTAMVSAMLHKCAKANMRYQRCDPNDDETVQVYTEAFAGAGVTHQMIAKWMPQILALPEFPSPAAVIELLAPDLVDDEVLDTVLNTLPNGETIVGLRDPSKPWISKKALEARMKAESEQKAIEYKPVTPERKARRDEWLRSDEE